MLLPQATVTIGMIYCRNEASFIWKQRHCFQTTGWSSAKGSSVLTKFLEWGSSPKTINNQTPTSIAERCLLWHLSILTEFVVLEYPCYVLKQGCWIQRSDIKLRATLPLHHGTYRVIWANAGFFPSGKRLPQVVNQSLAANLKVPAMNNWDLHLCWNGYTPKFPNTTLFTGRVYPSSYSTRTDKRASLLDDFPHLAARILRRPTGMES